MAMERSLYIYVGLGGFNNPLMCCLILILEQLSIVFRWDEQAAEHLPGYTKFFYRKVLATMKVIEKDLDSQGNKHADYVKKLVS